MSENTKWQTSARARLLAIPDDAFARLAPALDALHAAFHPLLADLRHEVEPATTLSEGAVIGQVRENAK